MRLKRPPAGADSSGTVWADCDVKVVNMVHRSITFEASGGKELLLTLGEDVEFSRNGSPCGIDEFLASPGMRVKVAYNASQKLVQKIDLSPSPRQSMRSRFTPRLLRR
ncbi:MAG: hypothetical protein FJ317_01145 [SAR202 cluster bacterium]|nr:hypothetical protein [SAR202 cluster bacterium]